MTPQLPAFLFLALSLCVAWLPPLKLAGWPLPPWLLLLVVAMAWGLVGGVLALAMAAVLAGCETFFHRGEQHYAPAGSVAVVCPDEIHDGEPYCAKHKRRAMNPA